MMRIEKKKKRTFMRVFVFVCVCSSTARWGASRGVVWCSMVWWGVPGSGCFRSAFLTPNTWYSSERASFDYNKKR